ncbi:S-protein homolog 1-like [Cucumis melo]|uniref:S-protein homolog n=2 Tax=Cucumis melo TaxID=3656 RepID=A0A1S3C8Z6_CUCME|nr:S-protein homolog 1-like [Cucumis melo]
MEALKSFALLILVLAFAWKVDQCYCGGDSKYQLPLTDWQVTIINYQINASLEVHCKSKDDDLGVHVIQNEGERYSWGFKENWLQTTKFWCNFQSRLGHASFEVFWPETGTWLSDRCSNSNCVWVASNDGFSLLNGPAKTLEFQHPWLH